jgi:hypothetical protein
MVIALVNTMLRESIDGWMECFVDDDGIRAGRGRLYGLDYTSGIAKKNRRKD